LSVHVFTLVLDGEPDDEQLDGLVQAGCDDAAFGVERGLAVAEFDREAPTLADAIASAVRAVESVGLKAVRVLDEDLLTLADIVRPRPGPARYRTVWATTWATVARIGSGLAQLQLGWARLLSRTNTSRRLGSTTNDVPVKPV
jgi:hypothetical protein